MPFFKSVLFCCTAILFICSPKTYAQKLKFEQLGIRQGLPSTEVYNLYQDKKGYVWAFSEYGIVKHNGVEFIPVCENIPVSESAIYVATENSEGEVYIANSKANIYKIKNDSAFLIKGTEKTSKFILSKNDIMLDMVIDDSSNIYFSTLYNSYKYSSKKNVVYDLTEYYSSGFTGICYKKIQNNYFLIKLDQKINSPSFITVLDEKDNIVNQTPYNFVHGERSFMRKQKEGYYFLTSNILYFLDNNGQIKKASFKENTINFEISADGRIWVGVNVGGLYELDHNLNIINHYLETFTVSDILFDNQSGMWVSTIENGAHYCKNIYDVYYENIRELANNISVLKKSNNKLFIGTANGDLFIKEKELLQKIELKNFRSYITDIIDNNNEYLIGTKDGIASIDTGFNFIKQLNTRYGSTEDFNCYQFSKVKKDTIIFVSASSIIKYYSGKITSVISVNFKTRNIIKRQKDEFLIGTNLGLFIYDNKFYCPNYLSELKNIRITKLKADDKQNIWICTRGSRLYKLTVNNKLIKFNNVPSDVINDISFINGGVVLLSTNKGLFINYTGDLNTKSAWILILDNETLSAEEYNNDIYIATKQGLISLSGKYLFKNDNSKFYLESIIINQEKIAPKNINLSYKQNDIYFNFDFLAYQFPDKKLFYQLYGNSSNKGIVKGTQIHLQNLSPGNYTLIVHPLINLSNKRMFKISFYIKPAFWQTNTFLILIAISILLIILSIAIYIIHRIKKKEERKVSLTATNALLAEYRLTALKAQINPHFISNSLSAIQQLIVNNEIDKANQYIAKFSLLIRYVLKYSDKSAVRLKHEIEIIDLNIDLEQLRFGNQFIFEKEINPEIIAGDIYVPPLITQPFIENAIWHGLLPLKNKRVPKLILKIDIISDKLIISVIDNGVGRIHKENSGSESADRESKGVWIIKNRMETLNVLYSTSDASINFVDLFDDKNEPAGTRVDIIFPISMLDKLYDDKNKERYY